MKNRAIMIISMGFLLSAWLGGANRVAASPLLEPPLHASRIMAAQAGAGHLAIPAAAFVPVVDEYNFENHGRYLKHQGPNDPGYYRALVQLPHGATVTRVTSCFYDDSATANGKARLTRAGIQDVPKTMATIASDAAGGYGLWSDDSVGYSVIDNSDYAYYVIWDLPPSSGAGNNVWGCGVFIEYLPPATTTRVISLAGPAFRPFEDGYNFMIGAYVEHYNGPGGSSANGRYIAQVHLPQRAVVEKMTLYFDDSSTGNMVAKLQRTNLAGSLEDMATIQSMDGTTPRITTVIAQNTIDNSNHAYWVLFDMPASSDTNYIRGYGVTIEYSSSPGTSTGFISLSNAAFTPFYDDNGYQNDGRWLFHVQGYPEINKEGVYVAPVYLPQGATITQMNAHFYDDSSAANGFAYLVRTRLGVNVTMAVVDTVFGSAGYPVGNFGAGGYVAPADGSIDYATVDNSQYAYFVYWYLPVSTLPSPPDSDVVGCGVTIQYKYSNYLPLIRRSGG